jgi:flagellar biosynthesis/type III secretory pathway M-ring protein FliF/YscJ
MDEMEIMNNSEEVVEEAAEKIVETNSGNGLKIGAGIGIALLVSGLAYKFIVKPIIANRRAKKEALKVIEGGAGNQGENDDNLDNED